MLLVLAVSLGLAVVIGVLHPGRPPWHQVVASGQYDIDLARARTLADAPLGVLWIDARTEDEYVAGHLEGALLMNEESWADRIVPNMEALGARPAGQPIVVYGDDTGRDSGERGTRIADRLRSELGHEPTYSLKAPWRRLRMGDKRRNAKSD